MEDMEEYDDEEDDEENKKDFMHVLDHEYADD